MFRRIVVPASSRWNNCGSLEHAGSRTTTLWDLRSCNCGKVTRAEYRPVCIP